MIPLVTVHGTWSRAAAWHQPGSAFRTALETRGFVVYDFLWSGILAGLDTLEARAIYGPGDPAHAKVGGDNGDLLPWLDAGESLAHEVRALRTMYPGHPVSILSHSHGLQVVAFSCYAGATYDVAVSVSGPIRRDMQRARRLAMASIGIWVQFADPKVWEDSTILLGELFGTDRLTVALPEGTTVATPGTGHSGFFDAAPEYWSLFDYLPSVPLASPKPA